MRRLGLALTVIAAAGSAEAQVRSVEVRAARPFGYFLGDLVRAQVEIVVEDGFALQAASLPAPGPLAYWLDLRGVSVEEARLGDARRLRLTLTYQNFYAALDARPLTIPGFSLTFTSDADRGVTTATAQVPPWSFGISPLREVQPPARENPADHMRPDAPVPRLDPQPARSAALGLAGLALIALGVLAHDRAWWPFRARRHRPFAAALRRLRSLRRQPIPAETAYREVLLALHRGLDETDSRRILADDLPLFLARHPAYGGEVAGLARALEASRLTFFGAGTETARREYPFGEVEATLRRLAAAERAA
jgi:mxaA protein